MIAPRLPDATTPSTSHRLGSQASSSHQSRPGAGVGAGGGVSQTALLGKYHSSISNCPSEGPSLSSKLRIYYQNVRGLRTKIDAFFLAVVDSDYDVIVLTETWLDVEILSPQRFGSSYRVFRNDRNERNSDKRSGGGVLIAVSSRLDCVPDPTPVCDTLEQLWVRVTVGAFYLPPGLNRNIDLIKLHLDSIGSVISNLDLTDSFIQLGDYNQPGLKWIPSEEGRLEVDPVQSHIPLASSYLIDGFNLHGLTQLKSCINVYDNCLDLVLVNDVVVSRCTVLEAVEPLVPMDIPHPAFDVIVAVPEPSVPTELPPNIDHSFNFRKANHAAIEDELSRVDWSFLETAPNIDVAVDIFQLILNNIFVEHVPLRRPPQKPPWSNSTLRKLKQRKATALQEFCNHRSPFFKSRFKLASRRYRGYNSSLYQRYVIKTQYDLRRNPKNFWSFVKSKRKTNDLPPTL